MDSLHAIDYDGRVSDSQYRAQRKEFNRQMIYCIVSIVIFFFALITSDPYVMSIIPGGGITLLFIDSAIIIMVLVMCFYSKKP